MDCAGAWPFSFDNSNYAEDSTARMKYLVNALASNEVHVAKYYLKREAWVAAANRAKEVLKTYPEAPALEEALAIMVIAYDKLKLNDLRDDAQRVLMLNFPNSKYATKGVSTEGKAWYRFWCSPGVARTIRSPLRLTRRCGSVPPAQPSSRKSCHRRSCRCARPR